MKVNLPHKIYLIYQGQGLSELHGCFTGVHHCTSTVKDSYESPKSSLR